jgi:glycosyltransferase involved in cell wall biosynthesis
VGIACARTIDVNSARDPAVWFPTVRTGTGTDVFTERLAHGLAKHGIRSEITWLPLRAEYAPWTVPVPEPPGWANVAHVNTWLHQRFLPKHLPIVATIHHSVHHPDAKAYKGFVRSAYHRFWIAPTERRVLRRADQVVAVSRFVADTARNTLLDVPMQVIYNGVDTDKFRPGDRQRKPDEPFRLLYVGNWKKLKGVDLLAPIMRELGDGFELRYTGGLAAERDKQAMPCNTYDIGRLQGEVAVVAAMQDADALLLPSRSEGHPLVAIEAMACGLPVIATRGSSLVDIVRDGVTGILCPQDDVRAFAAAATELSEKHDAKARQAGAEAATVFAIATMTNAYHRLYSALVATASSC